MSKVRITLLRHTHYGRPRLYPGCPLSKAICQISKGKTLSGEQASILQKIGECDVRINDVDERPIV